MAPSCSRWTASSLCLALLGACAGSGDDASRRDASTDPISLDGGEGDASGDGGPDARVIDIDMDPPDPCEGVSGVVEISGDITEATTWCGRATYRLTAPVFVGSGDEAAPAVLTLEPGTRIEGGTGGADNENTLVVTTSGQIEAVGTAAEPIVLTSGNAPGTARPGDWGGLVLLGRAPLNDPSGIARVEGLDPGGGLGEFGGADPTHDCGTLRYVRVEFGAYAFATTNELDTLTLAGCGTGTDLDYVQTHGGLDDGFEFFGGTANATHLVVSAMDDDGIDTDLGYTGTLQFVLVQASLTDHAFEMDNNEGTPGARPQSSPTVWNFTLAGFDVPNTSGIELAEGTGATLRNGVILGYGATEGIDADDPDQIAALDAGQVRVEHCLFAGNGTDIVNGSSLWDPTAPAAQNVFGVTGDVYAAPRNTLAPDFTPTGAVDLSGGATPSGLPADPDFDASASYLGAFAPGGFDWMAGWTAFPAF